MHKDNCTGSYFFLFLVLDATSTNKKRRDKSVGSTWKYKYFPWKKKKLKADWLEVVKRSFYRGSSYNSFSERSTWSANNLSWLEYSHHRAMPTKTSLSSSFRHFLPVKFHLTLSFKFNFNTVSQQRQEFHKLRWIFYENCNLRFKIELLHI